ncbi:hypothetical protein N2152v2_006676, partial [Parachlorella kessleri]
MLSGAAKAVEQAAGSVLPNKQGQMGDSDGYSDEEPRFPQKTMAAYMARQIVTDMLAFNQPPRTNLCTFVNTWMEPEAVELINATLHVNMADAVQYPACEAMEK